MPSNPVGPFRTNDYCTLEDVLARFYAGQGLPGSTAAPTDTTRDAYISDLIPQVSRDFDQEVYGAEQPGIFSWRLETRLFSGLGDPTLWISPIAALAKIEMDATPGQITSTWQDYSIEMAQRQMGLKPIRGFPKTALYRQATFYVDPFSLGNVRITGIWGIVLPDIDSAETAPDSAWVTDFLVPIVTNNPSFHGASGSPTLNDLSADGAGMWWKTPDDVRAAVAEWVTYRFQTNKAGGGVSTTRVGTGGGAKSLVKAIPDNVQRVINKYHGEHNVPRFALIADDGSDLETSPAYRWAGWQTR